MEHNGISVMEMACETARMGHMTTPSPPLTNGGRGTETVMVETAATNLATVGMNQEQQLQPKPPIVMQQIPQQSSESQKLTRVKSLDTCRVCGDGPARMHYGVPTCFGCKGFFRRTLKRPKEYTCRYSGNCIVDRYERNSCRHCRFKRCMAVGMDPKAVRPDRDAAGRSHPLRYRRSHASAAELGADGIDDAVDGSLPAGGAAAQTNDEWIRKLPVDMRTLLMQIMNIELIIGNGDTNMNSKQLYPLPYDNLQKILQKPSLLDGKRTEMRYETYRRVHSDEFVAIAHRRLVATIDLIDHLCNLMDINNIDDKVTLVKSSYAPLWILGCVSATARTTKNRNILCLCQSGYVPRGFDRPQPDHGYEEPYYFANRLVDRILDELVEPFRTFNFKEQEIVLMKTIVALNPHIRALSTEAAEQIADFRDRVQETLYNVVRESHPKEVASSRFGNLLLFLPSIMLLGNVMYENLQFLQSFGTQKIDPLLSELLDNIEPMEYPPASGSGYNTGDESSSNSIMRHSTSALSMSSTGTASTCTSGGSSEYLFNDLGHRPAINQSQENLISAAVSHNNLNVAYSTDSLNRSSQSSNMTLPEAESDPDYNMTLRADNYPDMRNAIVHSMEVDNPENCMAITSDYYSDSATIQEQQNRPNFFIDPIAANSLGNISQDYSERLAYIAAAQPTGNLAYCRFFDGSDLQQPTRIKFASGSQICQQSTNYQIDYGACQQRPVELQNQNYMLYGNSGAAQQTISQKAVGTRHIFTIEPTKSVYTENFPQYPNANVFVRQPSQALQYDKELSDRGTRINSTPMCQSQSLNFTNNFYPPNALMNRSSQSDLDAADGVLVNSNTSNAITKSQSYPYMLQEQFQDDPDNNIVDNAMKAPAALEY